LFPPPATCWALSVSYRRPLMICRMVLLLLVVGQQRRGWGSAAELCAQSAPDRQYPTIPHGLGCRNPLFSLVPVKGVEPPTY
jgi:hypothetical protein